MLKYFSDGKSWDHAVVQSHGQGHEATHIGAVVRQASVRHHHPCEFLSVLGKHAEPQES